MRDHKFDIDDKKELAKQELVRVYNILNRTPTQQEYKRIEHVKVTFSQIIYLFGTWNNAIEQAGLNINPTFKPPINKIDNEELINDFIFVANKLGKIPSKSQYRSNSKYSWRPYEKRFDSWKKTIEFMIDNHKEKFNFELNLNATVKDNFKNNFKSLRYNCPLIFEPSNEMETIVLFAYLAYELGYKIKSVQTAFPDSILIINDKEIEVEFEYLSSNYLQHGHPIKKGCICICWRKDIEINDLEIFSLEEYVRDKYY